MPAFTAVAVAAAAWSAPVDVGPAPPPGARLFSSPHALHLGWMEDRRTFVRVTPSGRVYRHRLPRAYREAAFDGRGRGLAVTLIQRRRPCRGKRSYRVYVEVRRLAVDGSATGRPQSLGDGCQNLGALELAVNADGIAVLGWLEIPKGSRGAKKRLVIAEGTTTRGLRAVRNSGPGDAGGHAVAVGARGDALVAYRRGGRMLVTTRPPGGRFGPAQYLDPTPFAQFPATRAVIDATGAAAIAWTNACACGEAGFTSPPNPLRVARRAAGDDRRFGPVQTLDSGEEVTRPPLLAIGGGTTAVAWNTENGVGTRLAGARSGAAFPAPRDVPVNAIAVRGDGTLLVAHSEPSGLYVTRGDDPPERIGPPANAFGLLIGPDRLLSVDGGRLKLSEAPG